MSEDFIQAGTIAISGHRDYPDRAGFLRGLDRLRADRYLLGGARGADTDALDYISRNQPGSQRVVVVPNKLSDQTAIAQMSIKQNATQVIELKNVGNNRYQIRNRYMVDNSDRLAAFTDGRKSGGTFNTIQYAESKGSAVSVIQLVEMDKAKILAMEKAQFETWLDTCSAAKVPQLCVKGMVLERMKKMARVEWPGVLVKLHRLR